MGILSGITAKPIRQMSNRTTIGLTQGTTKQLRELMAATGTNGSRIVECLLAQAWEELQKKNSIPK